jgi:hypothetical protein
VPHQATVIAPELRLSLPQGGREGVAPLSIPPPPTLMRPGEVVFQHHPLPIKMFDGNNQLSI